MHKDMIEQIQDLVAQYGLTAELLPPHITRVCVRGDDRAVFPIVCLSGPVFPDTETLAKLSTEITNCFDVGSVVKEIARKEINMASQSS